MKMCINTNLGSLTPDLFLEATPFSLSTTVSSQTFFVFRCHARSE